MKETRLFYCPSLSEVQALPEEEAAHAVRVLRLGCGDEIVVTDGAGLMARATITHTTKKDCRFDIQETFTPPRLWQGSIHLAVAPTKNQDRMEWFVEKATEIGVDSITFLSTAYSERSHLRIDRLRRNAISAMKQSHKAWLPTLEGPTGFTDFIKRAENTPYKYICHCYSPDDTNGQSADEQGTSPLPLYCATTAGKPLLLDILPPEGDALVMIGPEGDFSLEEVQLAEVHGFRSVSLGESRLRTETAALAAVHTMYLRKRTAL